MAGLVKRPLTDCFEVIVDAGDSGFLYCHHTGELQPLEVSEEGWVLLKDDDGVPFVACAEHDSKWVLEFMIFLPHCIEIGGEPEYVREKLEGESYRFLRLQEFAVTSKSATIGLAGVAAGAWRTRIWLRCQTIGGCRVWWNLLSFTKAFLAPYKCGDARSKQPGRCAGARWQAWCNLCLALGLPAPSLATPYDYQWVC